MSSGDQLLPTFHGSDAKLPGCSAAALRDDEDGCWLVMMVGSMVRESVVDQY